MEKVLEVVGNFFGYRQEQCVEEKDVDGLLNSGYTLVKKGIMSAKDLKAIAAAYINSVNAGKEHSKRIENGIKRDETSKTDYKAMKKEEVSRDTRQVNELDARERTPREKTRDEL